MSDDTVGGSLSRQPRYIAPGLPQHVIQRGNDRTACFASTADFELYRKCLGDACERYDCQLHAYVLMTNHVHLLMTPLTETAVSQVMQSVGRRYVRWFNAAYQRTGTLWEGRHKATLVQTEQYLFSCYRYIELNPVRAGLARAPSAYRWSSFHANAQGVADAIITPHEHYLALGIDDEARQAWYRGMFRDDLSEKELVAIRGATNKGWVLGSAHFRDEIARLLNRKTHWTGRATH
jgi:putative transposase